MRRRHAQKYAWIDAIMAGVRGDGSIHLRSENPPMQPLVTAAPFHMVHLARLALSALPGAGGAVDKR